MIVLSTYSVGHAQRDGRRYVIEWHTDSAGEVHRAEYLADVGTGYDAVMQARAIAISEQLAAQEAEEVLGG